MAKKTTLTATLPDGTTATRTTDRTYTHVVVGIAKKLYFDKDGVMKESSEEFWYVAGWCGSIALAQKLAKTGEVIIEVNGE